MKASARRRLAADLLKRRCSACRGRLLTRLAEAIWCEHCGQHGAIESFPYQSCYAPRGSR